LDHKFCLNNCADSVELQVLPRLAPSEVWVAITGDVDGAHYDISAFNDTVCLIGDWVTTDWTLHTAEGSASGIAGAHATVTTNRAEIDFNGSSAIGDAYWQGDIQLALSYSESKEGLSGSLALRALPGGSFQIQLKGATHPIKGSSSAMDGASGTWACSSSQDDMTWSLSNSTGSEVVALARSSQNVPPPTSGPEDQRS